MLRRRRQAPHSASVERHARAGQVHKVALERDGSMPAAQLILNPDLLHINCAFASLLPVAADERAWEHRQLALAMESSQNETLRIRFARHAPFACWSPRILRSAGIAAYNRNGVTHPCHGLLQEGERSQGLHLGCRLPLCAVACAAGERPAKHATCSARWPPDLHSHLCAAYHLDFLRQSARHALSVSLLKHYSFVLHFAR